MKYVVSQRALETMEWECRKFPDAETGGILVGFKDSQRTAITHATGPGPKADRSQHHFTKDTPYLQAVLNLLFQYYQVNYLGVWHKHPLGMPFPSGGDILSAMEEVDDPKMELDKLITPICVMSGSSVEILPFVIAGGRYQPMGWEALPHEQLVPQAPDAAQWYTTTVGQSRLAQEMAAFESLGVSPDVRKGNDGTYRFHVPLGTEPPKRMVMLCQGDYPVSPPEVAIYDQKTKKYEPLNSPILNDWNIYQLLGDLYREYQGASFADFSEG